jgi:hypothetical protein
VSWLDNLLDRGMQAKRQAEPAPLPFAKPAKPRQPKREIKSVWVQTRQPRNSEDPGAVEIGHYFVADGVVTMCDEKGKPSGKECRLGPDDDAHRSARRLMLEMWTKKRGEGDFNRPLHYSADWMA